MLCSNQTRIIRKLEEWEQKEGRLPSVVQLYRELLQIQAEAESRIKVEKPRLADELVRERLREGRFLLAFEDFSPDWDEVQTVFEQVAIWAAKDSEDSGAEVESLRNIARNRSLLREVAEVCYRGHSLTALATAERIDEALLASVIGAALKPFLLAYSRLLLPEVDQELWRRRYCPICGSKPDFAYLDKDRGARWLLCSRCDAEWLFQRLECPYCGTQSQDALAYFTDEEGANLYRLYICEQCHTYIKAVDLRRAHLEILLPLERVMTLDLSKQGQELGYKPG